MGLESFLRWNKIELGENIEIDKNPTEEEEITEETTGLVAETNEPIAENEEGEITEEMTEPVAKFFF